MFRRCLDYQAGRERFYELVGLRTYNRLLKMGGMITSQAIPIYILIFHHEKVPLNQIARYLNFIIKNISELL